MPSPNPYLDLLDAAEQEQTARINATSTLTFGTSPDAAARSRQVAAGLGVPPAAVEARPQESEQVLQARQIDADTAAAPVLRRRYTDADFHKLARDDSFTLSAVEKGIRAFMAGGVFKQEAADAAAWIPRAARAVASGAPKAGAGLYGAAAAPFELLGLDTIGGFLRDQQEQSNLVAARVSPQNRNAGLVERGVLSGFQSAGQGLLMLPLGLAGGQNAMLGAMGATTFGQSYGKARDAGLAPARAVPHAAADATAEVITERYLGAAGFLQQVKAGASAGKLFMYELAREVPGELAATLWQNFNEWANLNPDKSVADFIREQPAALAETVIATLVGGTTQIGAIKGIEAAVGRGDAQAQQAQQADQVAAALQQLQQLQEASKLAARDPGSFVELVREVAEEGEAPVEFYADAQQVATVLNQSGVPIETLRQAAPETVQQLENPTPGGDVRMPVAELVALGPQFQQPLLDHLRQSPEALSRAEAKQFLSEQEAKLKADVERELAQREEASAFRQQVEQAAAQFEAELTAVGRFRPEVNKAYASLLGNFYAVTAQRAGMPLADLLQKYQLHVTSQLPRSPAATLLRQSGTEPKGTIGLPDDITAAPSVISLLEKADLSTFTHVSGHFFREVQADLAARIAGQVRDGATVGDGERQIVDDMGRILEWFGVRGDGKVSALDTWLRMSAQEKEQHREQWARGFERFVMEGKAPSLELQTLFARFRAWLVQVYRTLTSLNVEISDDVRAVMGRMLASDQAIAEAQAARSMSPLFKTAEEAAKYGFDFAEWQAMQRAAEGATAVASAELDARLLKDMKWLSRARDKALKEAQAQADAARAEVEREVRAEVMAEPIYRAWAMLTGKQNRLDPGTVLPENVDPAEHSLRLRTLYVKENFPEQFPRLRDLGMLSESRGWDPDIVADIIPGFVSGEALVRDLAATAEPQKVIDELTDFRMLQRHGDIASPEALNRAADEAVHNELRARLIATELKALAKANKITQTGDDLYKKRDVVDVMKRAAQEYAAAIVARQQIRHLRPGQYAAAEARSAKLAEAALGKSTEEAAMHKRNQLVNNLAAKAAYEAQAEVRKGVEFFRRVMTGARDDVAKVRDWDMVQAARAVLAAYGLGPKGEAAQKYLEAVAQYDPATAQALRERVAALTAGAKPLNQLTVEEFRGLHAEIDSIWHMAKRSRQVEIDGKLIDIEAARLPLIARMEAIGIPAEMPGDKHAVTEGERRIARLRGFAAALRRVESWVDAKDGEALGPFRRFVWQPVKEAADRYRADKGKFLRRYRDLLARVDAKPGRIDAPELGPRGYTFGFSRGGSGKAELLHAILHTGNESNRRKLLLGRRWATERADGTLDTSQWDAFLQRMIDTGVLTRADFEFAQGVWDLLEEMKPLAQKTHRDVFGRYFDEVTAQPFTNQFGTWRGGYVPAMADAEVVRGAATRKLMEDENQALAFAFPSTNRGFTKGRVEYNAPLLLDLRVLGTHIDKVLLFSHMEQPIRDVRRILTSKAVANPLHRIDPQAFDALLTPWLNRAARQQVETPVPGDNGLMRFFSKMRSRSGIAAMFANVTNTAQQITGLSVAAVKVRPAHLLAATVEYVKAPRQTARAVAGVSPYMATRMDNEVAQMNDAIDAILLNPSVYQRAQAWTAQHAYFLQAAVDNVIGPIVWTGAYNQALEQGHGEADARRLADAAVRQTQGSTLPEDVSRIETGNAFARMFTQFAGYFNMLANLQGTEFVKVTRDLGLRAGMGRGLYVFLFGFLAPAMVSELIVQASRGGPDDEDRDGTLDDWLMSVLMMGNVRAALGMVPGVGQVANAAINTFNRKPYDDRISTAPAVSMIESAVSAPHSVYKAVADDTGQRRAVRDVATLITLTTGLPATAIARPLGYAAAVEEGKVRPAGPVDAVRGAVTGAASPESKR